MFSGAAAAAGNTSSPNIEISDINNGTETMSVTVNATSTTRVSNFTFWYDDFEGNSLGPTNVSERVFFGARYKNGTGFQRGDPLSSNIGGGKVTFVFNSPQTEYDYESDPFRVNVTANKEAYATAAGANRSVYTGSFYRIEANDHRGNELTNVPVLRYNANTNESLGFAFMRGNNVTIGCMGAGIGGSCVNPDTDSAGTLTNGESFKGPLAVKTFSLSQVNASKKVEPSVGTTTVTVDVPTAPTFLAWRSAQSGAQSPNVDNVTVVDASSGTVVWQSSNVGRETPPVLLKTNNEYTVSLQNKSSFGTENRSVLIPTKGMSGIGFLIDTSGLSKSRVTGQVVNESGSPVANAIVIAQPESSSGSQLSVYNSTTTDSNGVFTMQLPQTDELGSEYSFRLIGTDTSGNTLIYYPTIDANGGDGYVAPSSSTVLPPMTIREGGRVDITVTSNSPSLPVSSAFTSLSQESTNYPSAERTALSNGYSTFSFSRTTPASASVALMSPTTGSNSQVFYNVWGSGSPTRYLCANQVSVSQGSATSSTCKLEQAGYLNVSLEEYGSIIQQSSSSYAGVDSEFFFFQNELLVRNASTGDVVTHLGPEGAQQFFLNNNDNNKKTVTIPVPAGDYTVEVRPTTEFTEKTTVDDDATVTVTGGSTTDVQLDRASDFRIRPVFGRFDTSLNRSAGNTLAVQMSDPVTGAALSDTEVSVSAQLRHLNGTVASGSHALTYNSTAKIFDTTSFDPSALGVDAGRYELAITASHTSGTRTYNTTVSRPAQVTGFDTALDLGSVSVGPGNTLSGQIRAYSGGSGIDASASNVTIQVYNENGQLVKQTTPSAGISSGSGSFSVTMPDTVGRYQVAVKIKSDGGDQGIALRWVQVSQLDLEVSTDKDTYGPSDPVTVNIKTTNSTDGSAVSGATAVLRVNNNRVTATTDSNGEATVKLDPRTYATGSTWQRGHGISVTLAQETDTGVVRKTSGTFFEVRSFTASAEPTQEQFNTTESSVVRVTVPSSVTVRSVAVTELDGERVYISGSNVTKVATGVYTVDLGSQDAGQHLATVTVNTKNNGSETATTPFVVQDYTVSASLASRTVDASGTVGVEVAVRDPATGTVVSSQSVSATLKATDPVRTIDSASATTDSNGEATVTLSPSVSGPHYVEVTVGDQTRRLGLVVSNVNASFVDASGNAVTSYQATPGTSKTIYVNATKGGSAVADGSAVRAAVVTRDGAVELGSAKTTNGEASIDFTIPASVPAGEYTLVARVTTDSASGVARGTLNVTGASAKSVQATTNRSQFTPGDTVQFSATVTKGDGTAVANKPVDFVIQSQGAADRRVATVSTGSDGVATYNYTIPAGADDGEYVLKTALNNTQSITGFSGYRVSSIDVEVQAEDGPFNPGDSVTLTVYANDTATGNAVSATGGTTTLVLPGSNVEKPLSPSGSAPYTVTVALPSDSSIVGSRSITVAVEKDRQSDSDSTVIDVRDANEDANLTVSEPVTAGTATTVTANGTVDETAILTAYSPGTGTVAFNTSVAVSSSSDTTTQMTIDSAGTYVVSLSVPSVGEVTEVIEVQSASGTPKVWAGTSVNATAKTFTKSEAIHVQTNQSGLTATVVTDNASYSVPLDKRDGGTYYGVLSAKRPAGIYAVRLDSSAATNINSTIIEVKP